MAFNLASFKGFVENLFMISGAILVIRYLPCCPYTQEGLLRMEGRMPGQGLRLLDLSPQMSGAVPPRRRVFGECHGSITLQLRPGLQLSNIWWQGGCSPGGPARNLRQCGRTGHTGRPQLVTHEEAKVGTRDHTLHGSTYIKVRAGRDSSTVTGQKPADCWGVDWEGRGGCLGP